MQRKMQGGSEDVKPNQERRLKSTQGDDQQQQQPQPQKCPRCIGLLVEVVAEKESAQKHHLLVPARTRGCSNSYSNNHNSCSITRQPHKISSLPLIQPLNQPVNLGGDLGDTSNLGLLHGFSAVPAFGSQNQQQRQFYHVDNRGNKSVEHSFYPHDQESSIQSSRPAATSSHQQQNWHQGFTSNSNPTVSDNVLWSISTSTTIGHANSNINTGTAGSASVNPDRWHHDLPGNGPPS
ncbi:hypothetical protein NC651_010351 [Populus alba x Populus x berolinensis]|nr:hypothetical protein NC651_010351 [Populus alba x Populus x berolinensis]